MLCTRRPKPHRKAFEIPRPYPEMAVSSTSGVGVRPGPVRPLFGLVKAGIEGASTRANEIAPVPG